MDRIRWDSEERRRLIEAGRSIWSEKPYLKMVDILRQAQQQVLPPARQRDIKGITPYKWFEKELRYLGKYPINAEKQEPETQSNLTPPELSSDYVLAALRQELYAVIKEAITDAMLDILPLVENGKSYQQAEKQAPQSNSKKRKPGFKVMIYGLKPEQAKEVSNKFGHTFDLKFVDNMNYQSVPHVDHVILTRFTRHHVFHYLRGKVPRVEYADNGNVVKSVTEKLQELQQNYGKKA